MKIGVYHAFFRGLCQGPLKKIVADLKDFQLRGNAIKINIKFSNNAVLKIVEEWSLDNKELSKKESYTYQYITSDGFFFRYDMEAYREESEQKSMIDQLKKPDQHIHIGVVKHKFDQDKHGTFLKEDEGPHFKTHYATVRDILGTVVTNFFNEDEYEHFETYLENNKELPL